MARILHRCNRCGHTTDDHTRDGCSLGWCDCSSVDWEKGPSELMPTWSFHDGREVTTIVPPGTKTAIFGAPPLVACNCEDCRQLYADLTGGAS